MMMMLPRKILGGGSNTDGLRRSLTAGVADVTKSSCIVLDRMRWYLSHTGGAYATGFKFGEFEYYSSETNGQSYNPTKTQRSEL